MAPSPNKSFGSRRPASDDSPLAPESSSTGAPHQQSLFTRFARATSRWTGRPSAFLIAVAVVVVWALTGPIFQYSDTWQLVINTGTTVVTFLMVFLIQNSQNRDSEAIQLKLDELIRAIEGAQNRLINLEEMDEDELRRIHAEYAALAAKAHEELEREDRATRRGTAGTTKS